MKSPVTIRVDGDDDDCRETLDALGPRVELSRVRGPYHNRRGEGVRYYALAVVRPPQTEPGS